MRFPSGGEAGTMPKDKKPEGSSSRSFVSSLDRGLRLLEVLAGAGRPLTLSQLSKALGFDMATTTRFCFTLNHLGYIERAPSKQYQLTPKILTLGYGVVCGYDLCRMAEPYLRELSATLGETVNMAVLDGVEIIYVARFKTEQILQTDLHIGSKLPAYCTSMGKVMLAHLPQEEMQSIVDRFRFVKLTYRTQDSRETLLTELERVRRQGFATNDEELSVGLRSIAAPVVRNERPVAAVNIAVPTTRYSMEGLVSQLAPPLLETVGNISRLLQQQVGAQKAN